LITELSRYFDKIRDNIKLDPASEQTVIDELEAHVEDRLQEMRKAGLSDKEAVEECIGLLGSAKIVARQIYEAHSQGTWRQALLASMPHLFFALLFALKWWWDIGWLPILIGLIFGIVIYGWCHGKPAWLFPWIGYSLLPVVAAGLFLLYLPKGWAWVTILLYIPLVLWLLCYIIIKGIKRDWLYSALMLLPVPTIVGWFLVMEQGSGFSGYSLESLYDIAHWIGLSFLVLAVAVAIFVRLRQRWLKMVVLGTSGLITLTMVTFASSKLGLFAFILLVLLTVSFLIIPAFLDWRLRHNGQQVAT
jgi:hypothetical protein